MLSGKFVSFAGCRDPLPHRNYRKRSPPDRLYHHHQLHLHHQLPSNDPSRPQQQPQLIDVHAHEQHSEPERAWAVPCKSASLRPLTSLTSFSRHYTPSLSGSGSGASSPRQQHKQHSGTTGHPSSPRSRMKWWDCAARQQLTVNHAPLHRPQPENPPSTGSAHRTHNN